MSLMEDCKQELASPSHPLLGSDLNPDLFPLSFSKFIQDYGIDLNQYRHGGNIPRTIRIHPSFYESHPNAVADIELDLHTTLIPILDLPLVYRLKDCVKIASSPLYKQGKFYGLDVSSAIAAMALNIHPDDHVLDVCCAPGAKLCFINDLFGTSGSGTVTGVDISEHRLCTCRSLLKKYSCQRARLFKGDGTTFDILAPSSQVNLNRRKRERALCFKDPPPESLIGGVIKPFYAPKLLRKDPQRQSEEYLYDKVIVDAECTHDGSIAHVIKYDKKGWKDMDQQFLDPSRLASLTILQQGLITNGYRLLKPGGTLIYSTCSLSTVQNEEIIAWFLKTHQNAILERVPCPSSFKTAVPNVRAIDNKGLASSIQDLTIRLQPFESNTSGLYVAKIRKPLL